MATSADRQITNMPDHVALPRDNGELVFEAPWESRAFGMAVVMNEAGRYEWNAFVEHLAAEIRDDPDEAWTYYEKWLDSLADLAVERGLITPEELDQRTREYATGERSDDDH